MMKLSKNVMMLSVIALTTVFVSKAENFRVEESEISAVLQKEKGKFAIGKVMKSGEVSSFIDLKQLKEGLLQMEFLQEIEAVELTKNYFTIIGKEANDFTLQAYQIELVRDGDTLYLLDEKESLVVLKHSCAATASNADCNFKRGEKSKILGCNDNGTIVCNHTIASKEINIFNEQIKKFLKEII